MTSDISSKLNSAVGPKSSKTKVHWSQRWPKGDPWSLHSGKQTKLQPHKFEKKWQDFWEKSGIFSPDIKKAKKPYYNLMMFPYPSAEGLHVGNMYAFTGADVWGRFMRMQGYDVFEPIGLDGFGIHSENYALKVGRHPKEQAKISEANFYRQLRAIGNMFDWTKTLETYDPDYYRWTQWLFIQMFKHGLAYRTKAEVNWCPSCKTVLADEQVIGSKCERCSTLVGKKDLEQWFFKITDYAERLLQNTYKSTFDWPNKVKLGQQNWIGKKEGIVISYQLSPDSQQKLGHKFTLECFTTRPDTNFGATFIVLAPEHPLALKITTQENYQKVKQYIELSQKISKDERIAAGRKKTGVFTGSYAINQLNDYLMPIWVSDFVVMEVGTGAIVGVPGHDKRDFEFAKKFNLPIKRVVVGNDGDRSPITRIEQVQEADGTMINSGFLDGKKVPQAIPAMMNYLEKKGWGKRLVTYHLRDWLISRQRYWGTPIPMIYCQKCADKGDSWFTNREQQFKKNSKLKTHNPKLSEIWRLEVEKSMPNMAGWYPVPEEQLPVLLPEVTDWKPTGSGRGPLAAHPEFYKTNCPGCGLPAVRETDVCDTFLDSSWYYLAYPNLHTKNWKADKTNSNSLAGGMDEKKENTIKPWDSDINEKWLPVDSYIGGAEHTVLHLLYTRFVWMALRDWGYLEIKVPQDNEYEPDEPFKRFYAHGLIIKDGAKMSKSKGNVVIPDEYIRLYGSDTLRTYLMFLGPFDQGGDFRDSGIAGMYRWLSRVWRLCTLPLKSQSSITGLKAWHRTIKGVTEDLMNLRYNTAIAKLMELTNWWQDHPDQVGREQVIDFLKLLAPFAPYMTEELFQSLSLAEDRCQALNKGKFQSIHLQSWPKYDPQLVIEDKITVVIQINGKMRDRIEVEAQFVNNQSKIQQLAKKSAKVQKWLQNNKIKQTVFVPGKLINFVI